MRRFIDCQELLLLFQKEALSFLFFFEKKNQKTFMNLAEFHIPACDLIIKSFLLLFFKKEGLASLSDAMLGN